MVAFSMEEPTLSTIIDLAIKKSHKLSSPANKEPLLTTILHNRFVSKLNITLQTTPLDTKLSVITNNIQTI
jgi:hypothetical protein